MDTLVKIMKIILLIKKIVHYNCNRQVQFVCFVMYSTIKIIGYKLSVLNLMFYIKCKIKFFLCY